MDILSKKYSITEGEQASDIDDMFDDLYRQLTDSAPTGEPGDVFIADENGDITGLPLGSEGSFLRSGAAAPEWSALILPNAGAVGDLFYVSSTNVVSRLADVATGNALISGGVLAAPSWGKIGLTTHVSGTLPVANGGTGTGTAFTAGSVVFAGASGVYTQDNPNFFWDDGNNRLGLGIATPLHALDVRATSPIIAEYHSDTAGFSALRFFEGTTLRSSCQHLGTTFAVTARQDDLELVTLQTTGDITVRPNDSETHRFAVGGNLMIGEAPAPGSGTFGIVFPDGTALGSMGSNTAGIYANDVGGTVKMFGITETSVTGELTMNAAALTSGRLPLITTNGLLTDDAGLTYDAGDNRINLDQLRFPATQSASSDANTLDDYEEGTWTPTLTFATPGDLSVVYSVQEATYTKIGNRVIVNYLVITSTFTHTTAAGNMQITGLPFTSATETIAGSGAGVFQGLKNAASTLTQLVNTIGSGVTLIQLNGGGFGVGAENLTPAHTTTGTNIILQATIVYRAAA